MKRRALRLVFGSAGLVAALLVLFDTWERSGGAILAPWQAVAGAGALGLVGLAGAGRSWAILFDRAESSRLRSVLYFAQLGKYLPGGGIWQAIGQVGMSTSEGVSAARAGSGFAVHGLVQFVGGLTVGGLVAGTSQLPWWARAATGCGLLAPLLLYRPLLAAVLERLGRWLRLDRQEVEPPPQAVMLRSFAWVLVPVLAAGLAFALLVGSLGPEVGWAHATASFALAWAVGFAALPFPSGLGVREAVLVALVGAGTAQVLAASLTLRLVTIGAELVMIVASRRGLR